MKYPKLTGKRTEDMDAIVSWMRENKVRRLAFPKGVGAGGKDYAAFELELNLPLEIKSNTPIKVEVGDVDVTLYEPVQMKVAPIAPPYAGDLKLGEPANTGADHSDPEPEPELEHDSVYVGDNLMLGWREIYATQASGLQRSYKHVSGTTVWQHAATSDPNERWVFSLPGETAHGARDKEDAFRRANEAIVEAELPTL